MRNAMIDLFFVVPCIRFGDTLSHHLLMALFVAGITTVFALITSSVEQKVAAESTEHELVKLLLDEFVSVHFVDFAFAFTDGTLTT